MEAAMHDLTLNEIRALGAALGELAAVDAYAASKAIAPLGVGDDCLTEIEGVMQRVQRRLGRKPVGDVPRRVAVAITARLAQMERVSAQADLDDCLAR
jgi:hypothetical protein